MDEIKREDIVLIKNGNHFIKCLVTDIYDSTGNKIESSITKRPNRLYHLSKNRLDCYKFDKEAKDNIVGDKPENYDEFKKNNSYDNLNEVFKRILVE